MGLTKTSGTLKSTSPKKKGFPKIALSKKVKRLIKAKPQKRKFICEKCDEKFRAWWEMREHWLSTGHKEPEQCRWCGKKTYTLQSHLCKQHWNVATMCPYCGQLFMYQECQQRHLQNHDGSEYRCFMCGRRGESEKLLRNHMYNHYMDEKYGCNVCEKRFKKKKNMERHLRLIHFICQYCGEKCDNKIKFNVHLKIHSDLKCRFCQKILSSKARLKYHYQLQHGHQDFYKCTLCFQRFSMKGRLLDHMKLKHNGVSNFSCQVCAMPFLYWQHYLNHFENLHGKLKKDNEFMCSFCDFSTNLKSKLQWHMEKTSGNGFFCKKCQLRLECKGRFEKHMQNHIGERIWNCDYCGRNFASDDRLSHHMSNFHQEIVAAQNPRGYPCLVEGCNRYYAVKNSLSRHIRTFHSGNVTPSTTHSCSETTVVCRTPLIRKKRKREHQMELKDLEPEVECSTGKYNHMVNLSNITEVNVFYCGICETFWKESQFGQHMSTHQKNDWDDKCAECYLMLDSPEDAVRHYVEDHLKVEFVH